MNEWTVIDYCHYWDVPREFVVQHGEVVYYFDSPFDEVRDDYSPSFYVCRIPLASAGTPKSRWGEFRQCGERLPDIPVGQLRFRAEPIPGHPMRLHLHFVHDSVFDLLEKTRSAS